MSGREKLLTFLFDRSDRKVTNIKFFRGNAANLTVDELCAAALDVVKDTWDHEAISQDDPPRARSPRTCMTA